MIVADVDDNVGSKACRRFGDRCERPRNEVVAVLPEIAEIVEAAARVGEHDDAAHVGLRQREHARADACLRRTRGQPSLANGDRER